MKTARPSVLVTTHPLWRLRLAWGFSRYLLYALAGVGLLANARLIVDPPRSVARQPQRAARAERDMAAEGFACLFARRYLTWDAQDPGAYQRGLAPFVGGGLDAEAGLQPPGEGEQRVQWVEVVQEREPTAGERVYTIATQTDGAGLLYLTVSVLRDSDGRLELAGYPALVGAPASKAASLSASALSDARLPPVTDIGLRAVVGRALRNYLADDGSDLAADLTGSARVSLPGLRLTISAVQDTRWLAGGASVTATVLAADEHGTQYTLDYELDVSHTGGRWAVSAIEMDPTK